MSIIFNDNMSYTSMNDINTIKSVYVSNTTAGFPYQRPDLEVAGTFILNGKDVEKRLKKIEERLDILQSNHELESRWDKLKEIGNQYRKLEQELIETEKVIAILEK